MIMNLRGNQTEKRILDQACWLAPFFFIENYFPLCFLSFPVVSGMSKKKRREEERHIAGFMDPYPFCLKVKSC